MTIERFYTCSSGPMSMEPSAHGAWVRYSDHAAERARAEAAEARIAELEKALKAGVRAANLAIFVIRKQGVMPNSSWEAGFKSDLAVAEAALNKEPSDAD